MSGPAEGARAAGGGGLTIGVIAKDGLPHLDACLAALPAEGWGGTGGGPGGALTIILVDCCSGDGTTEAMRSFALARADTRVRRVEGRASPAVARNAVLDAAPPGAVLLLDGDMVLDPAFVAAGLARIGEGLADAVTGSLLEVHFDAAHRPVRGPFWRVPPVPARPTRTSGGAILLGPRVVAAGFRYDEQLRYYEDFDFALRISREHRLLRIPESVGTHLTHPYFGPRRVADWFRSGGQRNLGHVLRRSLGDPGALMALAGKSAGGLAGGAGQAAALGLLAAGQGGAAGLVAGALLLDMGRKLARPGGSRGQEAIQWLATRLFDPWVIGWGLLTPARCPVDYRVVDLVEPGAGIPAPSLVGAAVRA